MSKRPPSEFPSVTEEDVAWVCKILTLPRNAFAGADGTNPRLEILKSNVTLDIEACPGSGKTTLLVAKLAILARNWTARRRGICVLSHTNVARREIEKRLGNTAEGKRLLAYPHFVGTIHAFVNTYLALPWLRSKHFPIRMIDNEVCQVRRWNKLPVGIRRALETNGHDHALLQVAAVDFSVGGVRWGKGGILGNTTPTYQAIQTACKTVSEEGFFCHDEMFLWANELLDNDREIREPLRERFPMLFIDEVQDNSEIQSALLFRLFTEGDKPVLRQRFGDANQAIYQYSAQTEGATTDQFPDAAICKDIPSSYRFGQEIGNLANPLALQPQELVGHGPRQDIIASDTTGKHAIFIFNDQTVKHVINNYAQYLLELFTDLELRAGTFTAVGSIHRTGQDDKLPRSIGHYWPEYDYELTSADPKPKTFRQYVMAGRKQALGGGETHYIVEKIADGILRLVSISNPLADVDNRKRKHRYVLELLAEKAESRASYLDLVTTLALEDRDPTADEWSGKWLDAICRIAEAIGGTPVGSDEVKAFLEWQTLETEDQPTHQSRQRDNIFRYPAANPRLQVRVGSIHSVKGETHTATLVMETYFRGHHLASIKPWLLAKKIGRGKERVTNISRLKQHYVAMTRPSHLLCLAMREDAFTAEELAQLKDISWRVARVTDGAPVWL
ncbi:MAG: UvrD-helicase domain-containing protein [Candidatus Hydrogenedentales bacterium]